MLVKDAIKNPNNEKDLTWFSFRLDTNGYSYDGITFNPRLEALFVCFEKNCLLKDDSVCGFNEIIKELYQTL